MGAMNEVSLPLIVGWCAWVVVGLVIVVWARRVRTAAAALAAPASRLSGSRPAVPRPKSGVRPPVKSWSKPDAFGELQALLEPPTSASRRPGD